MIFVVSLVEVSVVVVVSGDAGFGAVVVVVVVEVGECFSSRDFLGLKLDKREKFNLRGSGSGSGWRDP